jgi:hypothetical protein
MSATSNLNQAASTVADGRVVCREYSESVFESDEVEEQWEVKRMDVDVDVDETDVRFALIGPLLRVSRIPLSR